MIVLVNLTLLFIVFIICCQKMTMDLNVFAHQCIFLSVTKIFSRSPGLILIKLPESNNECILATEPDRSLARGLPAE